MKAQRALQQSDVVRFLESLFDGDVHAKTRTSTLLNTVLVAPGLVLVGIGLYRGVAGRPSFASDRLLFGDIYRRALTGVRALLRKCTSL